MKKKKYIRPEACIIATEPLCNSIVNASVYKGHISGDTHIDDIDVKGEDQTSGMDIWDPDKWDDD